jgi:hypothetical protein
MANQISKQTILSNSLTSVMKSVQKIVIKVPKVSISTLTMVQSHLLIH